jgi:hypothetical protein
MRRLITVAALLVTVFAFGCGENPVQPAATNGPVQPGHQSLSHNPVNQDFPPSAGDPILPLVGRSKHQWQYVGGSNGELQATDTGTGIYSLMGLSTESGGFTANQATGASQGTSTWITASGDQITTSWTATPTSPTERLINVTITGGTGRFDGVTGSVIGHDTILNEDSSGGASEATWVGTLTK